MAVARKPTGKPARDTEAAAERFITGAVRAAPPAEPSRKTPVMMRFDAGLLARVDKAAKRRGISPLGLDCLHRVGGAGQRGQPGMSTASFARIKAAARAVNNDQTGDAFGCLIEELAWTPETVDELARHLLAAGITEERLTDAVRDAARARRNRARLLQAG